MTKIWVVYIMVFGNGFPANDEHKFTNESACQIYIHNTYTDSIQQAFKMVCVDVSPTMCQGEVCR